MNNSDLDAVLSRIARAVTSCDISRVQTAYDDVGNILVIASEHEAARHPTADLFELVQQGDGDAAVAAMNTDWRLATLLKALYLFGDIYVSVLLGEVANRTTMSMNSFIRTPPDILKGADISVILPAYCMCIYRNKLVVHHDVSRMAAFGGPHSEHGWHLSPLPTLFNWPQDVIDETAALTTKYAATIPELANESNCFARISLLFYGVPIGALGNPSQDRLTANRLAEKGGCRSATSADVLAAIDAFTNHVADVVAA